MRLKLPKAVERIEEGGRIVFFNRDIPSWVVTNGNGDTILRLCDGSLTLEEITGMFRDELGDEAAAEAGRFLRLCVEQRLFDEPGEGETPILRSDGRLSIVQFSISSKCNLNCKYCYATDRRESAHPQMTLADYKRVVDELSQVSESMQFSLTGGEPLLNKDCLDIAAYIKSKGFYVDLLTNATLIDADAARRISEVFDKVTVSVDGSTRELHEAFRGAGAYGRTEAAIGHLVGAGIDTRLSMTVNRLNIHDIGPMSKKYGPMLSFAPLFPAGNANKTEEDISITGLEYYEALKNAEGVNPLSYCESSLDGARECRSCKCAVGDSELSFSATGDVYPCQLLHYPQFLIGNIHEHSAADLYRQSAVVEACRSLTVDSIPECAACFLKYVCGGACRARAFHECGDIRRSGAFCEYEKRAFVDGIVRIYSTDGMRQEADNG